MKRAWFIVDNNGQTFNNYPEGQIMMFSQVSWIWDIFLFNDGWVSYRDFDDTGMILDYVKAVKVNGEWVLQEDQQLKIDQEALKLEQSKIGTEVKKMNFGQQILAYFGVLTNDLTVEDYQTLLADPEVDVIKDLLRQGALESSFDLLTDYPINSIITQTIKDKILARISYFLAQV